MKCKPYALIVCILLLISTNIHAQQYSVSGKVTDEKSGVPLAFVNIITDNSNHGTSTDIDGKFTIKSNTPINQLKLTYVGYYPKTFIVPANKSTNLTITLTEKLEKLPEVSIIAGENPALRIIRNVINNSSLNNPEKQHSFEYTSYNKMIFTLKTDTVIKHDKEFKDTTIKRIKKLFKEQHLLIMESVTKRKFLHPDKNYEEVLASKMSGFKDPMFTFIASQIQSFSFYNDKLVILDKNYINPLSNGSLSRYFFAIEDTLLNKNNKDTTFVISYRPKKNTNFDGLKGLLYINTYNWALENVTAAPSKISDEGISIGIQQKYELIDGKQWFPTQLNTDIVFKIKTLPFPLVANARGYLKDITLNPVFEKKEFNNVILDFNDSATQKSDTYWSLHRIDSLTKLDLKTYHVIDSIGEKNKFDKKFEILQTLFENKFPINPLGIDLDIDKFFDFNEYENFRLGVGAHTNNKISKIFKVGGYWGWGFNDKDDKYGADLSLSLNHKADLKISLAYCKDLLESGTVSFHNDKTPFFEGNYDKLFANYFDKTEMGKATISFRTARYMQVEISMIKSLRTPTFNYQFATFKDNVTLFTDQLNLTEFSLGLRYAYKEKVMKIKNHYYPLPTSYPIAWFNYTRGVRNLFNGEYAYNKYDLKIQKSFYTNFIGKTTFIITSGYVDVALPYSLLYNGKAGFNSTYLDVPNYFNTMRYNEFLSDKYISLNLRHSFGSLLFRLDKFKPEIVILTNILYGTLAQQERQQNITFKTPNKGYFESGLMINNVLKLSTSSIGFGTYYRYGYYALENKTSNWAFKFSLTMPIE